MKKVFFIVLLLACPLSFAQEVKKGVAAPSSSPPPQGIKLPAAQADKIKEVEASIQAVKAEAERRIRELMMAESNLILASALELHLTKAEYEAMAISADANGELFFVPKPKE